MIRFANFTFDPDRVGLAHQGETVQLEPQALRLLEYLITHRERIVPKEELIDEIWDGRAVTDAALNTRIRSLRRALGDDGRQQSMIRTFPRRGFQFVAPVETTEALPPKAKSNALRLPVLAAALCVALLALVTLWHYSTSEPVSGQKPSIAVLRLENLTPDEADQYLVDGLTEDLTIHLSRYRELFVISSATVFSYDNADSVPLDIARDLGVAYGLRGSLRRDGDRIRVTSELIDMADAKTVWTEQFETDQTGIFEMQDQITRAIVGQLVPEIMQSGVERLSERPTNDMGAWDLYLKARAEQAVFSKEGQEEALWLTGLATAADPEFAAAHSLAARALGTLFFFGWADDPPSALEDATTSAKRAIALDPSDAQAHAALGYIYRFTGEAEPAITSLERAKSLNPNSARIRLELAHTLDWFRLQERALPEIETAIRLSPRDPLLSNMFFYKGHILFHLERYEEALTAASDLQTVATSKTWLVFHHLLRAAIYARMNRAGDAKKSVDEALAINPKLSLSAMQRQFDGSKNHPENRRIWLASLKDAGLPP